MDTLIWSPLLVHAEEITDVNDTSKALITRLKDLEDSLNMPVKFIGARSPKRRLVSLGHEIAALDAYSAVLSNMKSSSKEIKALNFPRDIFTIYGSDYVVSPFAKKIGSALLKNCSAEKRFLSVVGEGGVSINAGKYSFVLPYDNLFVNLEPQGLVQEPVFLNDKEYCPLLELMCNGVAHLDLNFNAIHRDGNYHFFATAPFYDIASNSINSIVEKNSGTLDILSKPESLDYCAINFPVLPNGKVIVSDRTPEVANTLSAYLNKEDIVEIPILDAEASEFYGLRCRTNVLDENMFKD